MDMNVVVVSGRLAAPSEVREFDSGTKIARLLVTVRSDSPRRRVDVLPISMWVEDQPDVEATVRGLTVGDRVLVTGSIQRRFWSGVEGRQSRLELSAHSIESLGVVNV